MASRLAESGQTEFDFEYPLPLLTPDEIYESSDPSLLQGLEEDRRVERKPPHYKLRDLGDYFSMWANTPPDGGLIAVGMSDNGEFLGLVHEDQSHINSIEAVGPRYCSEARFESKRVPVKTAAGQDFIILFRVYYHATKVVRTSAGDAFHRIGDEKRKLSQELIRELEIDKGQLDLELEPSPYKYPDDFDEPLIEQYANAWRSMREIPDKPIVDILRLSHLGNLSKAGFEPNSACALLFAKDPTLHFPGCFIRFFRFEGEEEHPGEKWNAVKNIRIDPGPLPKLITEAAAVLEAQLRSFSRFGAREGKFDPTPEYPRAAWYEALVNACAHRSYGLKTMNIFVKMFDDRLEFESPGGLPFPVTPENIYYTHQARNPRTMEGLRYLSFVQCAYEGARRIRDTMEEMELPPPKFEQRPGDFSSVRVTLRNNIKLRRVLLDSDLREIVSSAIFEELSEADKRAINYVAEHGRINVTDLHRLTGHAWQTCKKRLMRLTEMRVLRHVIRDFPNPRGRDSEAHFVLRNGRGSRE